MRSILWLVILAAPASVGAAEKTPHDGFVQELQSLDTNIARAGAKLSNLVPNDIRRRLREANAKSTAAWQQIDSREAWEKFRATKLQDLKASLNWPHERSPLTIRRTGGVEGEGFTVDNLVFESRPGLWVTANLYRPAKAAEKMPGFLICHSHHNPKTESELQTMGMTWARAGCLVLVMDQLGHGERRQHPFRTAEDYPKEQFRAGRQDYWFRYDVSLQLYLAGESLMGYMAWDLSRGVDVLLAQEGIDAERIILLGAVAGGGDPAAVAGALEERITVVGPFNFGGPQPETRYPLPDDAEQSFGYAGSGSWESTRNLAGSASAGFLPWVIVGSVAPRKLIYGHEFSWDRERDPVWKRLNAIYRWSESPDSLAFAHGTGLLKGQPPEASHCNNIGAVHRRHIHAALKKWYGIDVNPDEEYRKTFSADQLRCWTPEALKEVVPQPVRNLLARQAAEQAAEFRAKLSTKPAAERRELVRNRWQRISGSPELKGTTAMLGEIRKTADSVPIVEQNLLDEEHPVPTLLLFPGDDRPFPVVVCVAQQGKDVFLKSRADAIARLLEERVAVCLVDVRGTGEAAVEDRGRDRTSYAPDLSSSELMLGGTILGQQFYDFRRVLRHLREHKKVDAKRIALWGESFATVNAADREVVVPHGVNRPNVAEPLGGMLVLLAGLFEPDLKAIAVHRGLVSYHSALDGPCLYMPHDSIVPGAIAAGDVALIVEQLETTPLRLWDMVDATNRPVTEAATQRTFAKAKLAQFDSVNDGQLAIWFVQRLSAAK
jgi:cephalosporin-C deacetylase-like acetyl esterase